LSIDTLVNQFGMTLYIRLPAYTVESDGSISRQYGRVFTATGFIQPASQSEPVIQGRYEGRTSATIYFAGTLTIGIDYEIHDSEGLTARQWRVTGVVNPAELGQTGARPALNMTVVDCVEVEPDAVGAGGAP
jgi:hypothetical protein